MTLGVRALVRAVCMLALAVGVLAVPARVQGASDEITGLRDACEGGDANSCNSLGYMYSFGQDVEADPALAAAYYARACDGGEIFGCSNLANMYLSGEGVAQDYEQAAVYFQKACDGGGAEECATLGWAYLDGEVLVQNDAKAMENFQKACDAGNGEGCLGMGIIHEEGLGVPRDAARAVEFYGTACDGGSADGCATLGEMYAEGRGVEQNSVQAFDYYGRGCTAGNAQLCNMAAAAYETGVDVARDEALAVRYYRRSCSVGDEDGCGNLDRLFPGETCPCFDMAEILTVCPRPDADATQRLVQSEVEGSRKLECFSTRNYSPGSIMFEVYPAFPDDRPPSCFVQSVEVEPYGSGGSGMDLTPAWLAGCVKALDDAGAKLGLQLTRE